MIRSRLRLRLYQGTLMIISWYAHGQPNLRSRSDQGYVHDHLKLRSWSPEVTLMITSRCAHDQLKARSRSAQVTLNMSSRYAHDQLKISSRSAQGTVTISSKSTTNQVFASSSRWAILRQTYLYAYCVRYNCCLVLTGSWLNNTALHSTACYMFRLSLAVS
jgi:hypothetical protein